MVTAVVGAGAVLVACALTLLAVRRANERADRRLREALHYIDAQLEAMSSGVVQAIDAAVDSERRLPLSNLSLDFDEVLESLMAETRARTGADAVVLRIEGPQGRPVVASMGAGVELEGLDRSFGPPAARPFRSAVVDWTYPVGEETDVAAFGSALVTPLTGTGINGTLVAYARASNGFSPADASSARDLLEDMSVGLANARRFAEIEARLNLDPATGVPNRRGYELELGREAARAHRTGRPLSMVVVDVEGRSRAGARRQRTRRRARASRGQGRAARRHRLPPSCPRTRDPASGNGRGRCERPLEADRSRGEPSPRIRLADRDGRRRRDAPRRDGGGVRCARGGNARSTTWRDDRRARGHPERVDGNGGDRSHCLSGTRWNDPPRDRRRPARRRPRDDRRRAHLRAPVRPLAGTGRPPRSTGSRTSRRTRAVRQRTRG